MAIGDDLSVRTPIHLKRFHAIFYRDNSLHLEISGSPNSTLSPHSPLNPQEEDEQQSSHHRRNDDEARAIVSHLFRIFSIQLSIHYFQALLPATRNLHRHVSLHDE